MLTVPIGSVQCSPAAPAPSSAATLLTTRPRVPSGGAIMKRWYGYGRVRYRSLGRNALQLQLLALALNLRRALVLTA